MKRELFEKLAEQRVLNLDIPLVSRDEEKIKTSFNITDTAHVPSVGQAIYRAFNTNLKISGAGIKQLQDPVTTKDGTKHLSPQAMFEQHKGVFEEFLKSLPAFFRRTDMRVNMTNILKVMRGYDWQAIGWLAYEQRHRPQTYTEFDRSEGV